MLYCVVTSAIYVSFNVLCCAVLYPRLHESCLRCTDRKQDSYWSIVTCHALMPNLCCFLPPCCLLCFYNHASGPSSSPAPLFGLHAVFMLLLCYSFPVCQEADKKWVLFFFLIPALKVQCVGFRGIYLWNKEKWSKICNILSWKKELSFYYLRMSF